MVDGLDAGTCACDRVRVGQRALNEFQTDPGEFLSAGITGPDQASNVVTLLHE